MEYIEIISKQEEKEKQERTEKFLQLVVLIKNELMSIEGIEILSIMQYIINMFISILN